MTSGVLKARILAVTALESVVKLNFSIDIVFCY